jgi:hypothetical protein
MTRKIIISVVLLSFFLAFDALHSIAQSAPQVPPTGTAAPLNPLKIAQLKWYPANSTTTFGVGREPRGACFDGANIWVANYGSNNTGTNNTGTDGTLH